MKKNSRPASRRLFRILVFMILTGMILASCAGKKAKDPEPYATAEAKSEQAEGKEENMNSEEQGKHELYGIKYESSSGSMVYHSEFAVEVNREEMVSCAFWPEGSFADEMTRKEHVPLTKEQWADLESIIGTLLPLTKKIPESVLNHTPDPELEVLDGGGYTRFSLTFETDSGLETDRYYWPQDRRVTTLITILWEIADPQGREIVWYPEPVLCGLFFSDSKNNFSWQMTLVDQNSTDYRYITYFMKDGKQDNVNIIVGEEVWQEAYAFLAPLDLRSYPEGGYNDKYYCTLYISDNSQDSIRLDKKTAADLRGFLTGLTEKVKQK